MRAEHRNSRPSLLAGLAAFRWRVAGRCAHGCSWPGKLEPIPWVYAEIVRALHATERVEILCHDEGVRDDARAKTADVGSLVAALELAIAMSKPEADRPPPVRR